MVITFRYLRLSMYTYPRMINDIFRIFILYYRYMAPGPPPA
jgi:hypothetical protein